MGAGGFPPTSQNADVRIPVQHAIVSTLDDERLEFEQVGVYLLSLHDWCQDAMSTLVDRRASEAFLWKGVAHRDKLAFRQAT